MSTNILIVIVLYGRKLEQSSSFKAISPQCDNTANGRTAIYVYDNSKEPDDLAATRGDVVYVHSPENKGLGFAYNRAAEWAAKHGFDWLLLLDQDTILPNGLLRAYWESISNHQNSKIFVPRVELESGQLLSPFRTWGRGEYIETGREYPLRGATLINSGLCVHTSLFNLVGGYKESVWLDFSDIQFTHKLAHYANTFYIIPAVCMQDFSGTERDKEKLKKRYRIYLQCAKACDYIDFDDYVFRQWCVCRHTLALTLKVKSLYFIKDFFRIYVI